MLSAIEQKASETCKYDCFKAVNLESIKNKLSDILTHLRDNGFFKEYTQHDISHIDGMFEILNYIIPENVAKMMTSADWLMLVLAVYFHDYGMLVVQEELDRMDNDEEFQGYKVTKLKTNMSDNDLYQDYVRIHHGDRIYDWLNVIAQNKETKPYHKIAVDFLKEMVGSLPENVLKTLALLCKSHQMDMVDVYECLKDKVDYPYSMSQDTTANLFYVASLLRTADLLHINKERTPDIAYKIISPKNEYSKLEWDFQKGITCIRPKKETNRDGKVDLAIKQHTIQVFGAYKNEKAYQRLNKYLDYAESEIKKTYRYCKQSQEDNANEYYFPWDSIDRSPIVTEGFYGKPIRFELDKKNILKLLIGHTLYNNPNVVLRELAQNAIDACRLMNTHVKEGTMSYVPKVVIDWNSKDKVLKIQDNGTGMNDDIILKYLLKVGMSRYQSEEFKKKNPGFHSISRFGIGLLTCFMISDQIEMYSLWEGDSKAYKLCISEVSNEYILRNDAEPSEILEGKHGTTFILKVHDDVDFSKVLFNLKRWIIVPRCRVEYIEDGHATIIGYNSEEEAIKSYMTEAGLKIDDNVYRLKKQHKDNMTICTIEKKNEYMGEWLLYVPENRGRSEIFIPIGTCVEGIMVSTSTPGFKTRPFLALVNCAGNEAPNTNVARDQLEESKELSSLNKFIYDFYLKLISDKINIVADENSLSWKIKMFDKNVDSFLDSCGHDMDAFADSQIFNECLSEQQCYLVDSEHSYHKVPLNQIGEEVLTIDSYAYDSAMHLSQELSSSGKTAMEILASLDSTYEYDKNSVLSIVDSSHYTYELFLKKYEVYSINIDKKERKIVFGWKIKENRWHSLQVDEYYFKSDTCNIFIENGSGKVLVDGMNSPHFIKSKFGFMILSNSPLGEYLCTMLDKKIKYIDRCVELICFCFLRAVSDNDLFSVEAFNRCLEDEIPSELQDFYEYVDEQLLNDILQNEKYNIVSLEKLYNAD